MSRFDSAWLALRAQADTAARSERLGATIGRALESRDTVRAIDLACGTGANARYLMPILPPRQRWLLVDDDPALLGDTPEAMAQWASERGYALRRGNDGLALSAPSRSCDIETRRVNLATASDLTVLDGQDLVTGSALLDLVSAAWLSTVLSACRDRAAAVLFALSYDGRVVCTPRDPEDEVIRELVNRHQQRDKGFGPALGPGATDAAAAVLKSLGYLVERAASDWVLPPEWATLQTRVIAGWAEAAAEMRDAPVGAVEAWATRRLAHVARGVSQITVGHSDLAARLPNTATN
jgi:hypothetical protein